MSINELSKNIISYYDRRFNARTLAILSICIWLSSLFFTVFGLSGPTPNATGFHILLVGWLGPLALNFAWYSNLFYLFCFSRIIGGSVPHFSAILAFLLSLQALTFNDYILNEAGYLQAVNGYGLGFLFWLMSIFLIVAATGKLNRELYEKYYTYKDKSWMEFAGIGSLLLVAILSTYLSINDRIKFNHSELENLNGLVFKKGEMCENDDFVMNSPIEKFTGSIELALGDDKDYGLGIEYLLQLGVKKIRINGFDYSSEKIESENFIISKKSEGDVGAVLNIINNRAMLVEKKTDRIVFDITLDKNYKPRGKDCWRHPMRSDYSGNFKDTIIYALKLDTKLNNLILENSSWNNAIYIGLSRNYKYVNIKDNDNFTRDNAKCPPKVGIDYSKIDSLISNKQLFEFHDKSFYINNIFAENVLCDNDSAFIYKGYISDGKYNLFIRQRSLIDFKELWHANIVIENIDLYDKLLDIRITEIVKNDSRISIKLYSKRLGVLYSTTTILLNPISTREKLSSILSKRINMFYPRAIELK